MAFLFVFFLVSCNKFVCMPKLKTIYVCKNCGNDSPKWFGKCSACGEWNTCVEEIEHKESKSAPRITGYDFQAQKPILLHEIEISQDFARFKIDCPLFSKINVNNLSCFFDLEFIIPKQKSSSN